MTKWITLPALVFAVCLPQFALALPPRPNPAMKVTATQSPDPAPVGKEAELKVLVEPPAGFTINRFPGITLKLNKDRSVTPAESTGFVGTKEPPGDEVDPADYGFKKAEPIVLKLTPAAKGKALELEGTLSYTFCDKKSGTCYPGKQAVKIPLRVAG